MADSLMTFARVGVITGVQAEQDAFFPKQARSTESHNSLIINRVSAPLALDRRQPEFLCCTPGIGKVNAAAAAAYLVSEFGVDLLAIIGTAGKIDPTVDGGAYLLTEAVHADYGAYRGGEFVHYRSGSLPIGEADNSPFVSTLALGIVDKLPDVATARIATGDSFVEDAGRSRALAETSGAALVDMETAAIAQVAERLGIPWLGVKAVSDDANNDSASDFAQQLALASSQAADLFERLFGL